MRPSIATVVSPFSWERDLVAAARVSGLARVVRRCRDPQQVDGVLPAIDALLVGAETPWIGAHSIGRWRRAGPVVVGMADPADRAARRLLCDAGCDVVASHLEPPASLLGRLVGVASVRRTVPGTLVHVTGPRGAPGRSEVALALAWQLGRTARALLIELDGDAPSLGLRLGLPPTGDRFEPAGPSGPTRVGPLSVLTVPAAAGPLAATVTIRLVETARSEFDVVVLDRGPAGGQRWEADDSIVFVCKPSPTGLVRAARLMHHWTGPVPSLVLNRVTGDATDRARTRDVVSRALGLEPAAVVPEVPAPEPGLPPDRLLIEAVGPVAAELSRLLSEPPGTSRGSADHPMSPAAG